MTRIRPLSRVVSGLGVTAVLLATVVVGAAAPSSAVAQLTGSGPAPWTTILVFPGSGEVEHYTTPLQTPGTPGGGQLPVPPTPADGGLLGSVTISGARAAVAEPDGAHIWVLGGPSSGAASTVTRVAVAADGSLSTTGTSYPVGEGAADLALSPDGRHLLTANAADDSVTMIDIALGEVIARIPVADGPRRIVVAQDGLSAYTAGGGVVSYLDLVTARFVAAAALGGTANDVAISPDGTRLYAARAPADGQPGGIVPFHLDEAFAPEPIVPLGSTATNPKLLAIDPLSGDVWAADGEATAWRYDTSGAAPAQLPAASSSFVLTGPVTDFVVNPDGATVDFANSSPTVVRVRLDYGFQAHPYQYAAASGQAARILALPGRGVPVTISGPSSVNRHLPVTFTATAARPGDVVRYEWDFRDGTTATTTAPTVDHVYDVEGMYSPAVTAFTALDAATATIHNGRSTVLDGDTSARAFRSISVNPAGLGSLANNVYGSGMPGTANVVWYTVPSWATSLHVTARGFPGGAGTDAPGYDDPFCDHVLQEECGHPGSRGSGSEDAFGTVIPVGGLSDLVQPGDEVGIIVGHAGTSPHGWLSGGASGEGGGVNTGDGGTGGGGSGIFLRKGAQWPWLLIAPGGGGGGGASGLVREDEFPGGKGAYDPAHTCSDADAYLGGPNQAGEAGHAGRGGTGDGGGGGGGGGCPSGAGGVSGQVINGGGGYGAGRNGTGGNAYSRFPMTPPGVPVNADEAFVRVITVGGDLTPSAVSSPTSDAETHFTEGSAGSFQVTIGGYPDVLTRSGALPAGVSLFCVQDVATSYCSLAGTPAAGTAGVYPLVLASPVFGWQQNLELVVQKAAAIAAPGDLDVHAGAPFTEHVTSTGTPGRRLGVLGVLPDGVRFEDSGDGTGQFTGTPAAGSDGVYPLRLVVAQDARSLDDDESGTWAYSTEFELTVGSAPDLKVTVGHAASFAEGSTGNEIALTVANVGVDPASGITTVHYDLAATGLTATAIAGDGWSCTLATLSCTRADTLAASGVFPDVVVTVDALVGAGVGAATNTASVHLALDADTSNDSVDDVTTVTDVASPIATADHYSTAHGTPLTAAADHGVLANDSGAVGALTAELVSGPGSGTLQLGADGAVAYTPASGFSGDATFRYRAVDGIGQASDAVTVTITVAPASRPSPSAGSPVTPTTGRQAVPETGEDPLPASTPTASPDPDELAGDDPSDDPTPGAGDESTGAGPGADPAGADTAFPGWGWWVGGIALFAFAGVGGWLIWRRLPR